MNAKETLEKYGLKADVKSIKERMNGTPHFNGVVSGNLEIALKSKSLGEILRECQSADLTLLCELAEKGERYEKAVKDLKALEICRHAAVDSYIENWENHYIQQRLRRVNTSLPNRKEKKNERTKV